MRQNTCIKGISIANRETKLLQYSDDTTVTLADINSARALFIYLFIYLSGTFNVLSGLAINYDKSRGHEDWYFQRE